MAVEPNSIIRLLHNIPLNIGYENTLWFEGKGEQAEYFIENTVKVFNKNTYQRVTLGKLRVECLADDIFDCNYLMFMNSNYSNKWFYAFVTNIRYINDNTTEVIYVIDYLQSYLFEMELGACFVDREHSSTDNVGDNLIPEDVQVPDYEYSWTHNATGLFDNDKYTIATISSLRRSHEFIWSHAFEPQTVTLNPCMLTPSYYKSVIDIREQLTILEMAMQEFNDDIDDITTQLGTNWEDISCAYLIPSSFVDIQYGGLDVPSTLEALPKGKVSKDYKIPGNKPTTLGSYGAPRNKKLLTYPFNKLVCNTFDDYREYRYEYFSDDELHFHIFANLMPPTSFKGVPVNYNSHLENFNYPVVLEGHNAIPFGVNRFAEWINKNGAKIAVLGLAGLASANAATALALGGSLGGGEVAPERGMNIISQIDPGTKIAPSPGQIVPMNNLARTGSLPFYSGFGGNIDKTEVEETIGGNGVTNDLVEIKQNNTMLPLAIGGAISALAEHPGTNFSGTPTGQLEVACGEKDFFFFQAYPKKEYCEMLDMYFDMYGYATKKVKVPNIHVRMGYTYTRTLNAVIKGKLPAQAIAAITNIFNHGIRFWSNPYDVGDYTINNAPL